MIKKINNWIALNLTSIVSTMWCAYAFLIITLIPLYFTSTTTVLQYVSSGILQLVFLPLLAVGANIQGEKTEKRAKEDHEMITTEIQTLREEVGMLTELLENQKQTILILTEIHNTIVKK